MTSTTTPRPQRHTDVEFDREHRKGNWLIVAVVILGIIVVGLGAWIIYDANTSDTSDGAIEGSAAVTATVPAEVDTAIETYIAAWENPSGEAFLAAVTDDFIINEYIYFQYADGVRLQDIQSYDDREYVAQAALDPAFPWIVERGDMVSIVGDGPWYVSFPETWQVESNLLDGMATYMLIDVDGVVKVKNHYWIGISGLIEF